MGSCPARRTKRNFDTRFFKYSPTNRFSVMWTSHDVFDVFSENGVVVSTTRECNLGPALVPVFRKKVYEFGQKHLEIFIDISDTINFY